jgi:hypothetical protein
LLPTKALKVNGGAYAQLGGNGGNRGLHGQGFGGFGGLQGGGNQGIGGGNQSFAGGNILGQGGGNLGVDGGNFGLGGNQGGVWMGVTEFHDKLMSNAGVEVRAKESPSSLQWTLENDKVKQAVDAGVTFDYLLSERFPAAKYERARALLVR